MGFSYQKKEKKLDDWHIKEKTITNNHFKIDPTTADRMKEHPASTMHTLPSHFWNLFCMASLIGIWPRYIEPHLLFTSHLNLKIPSLPPALRGLKILQISDLHLNQNVSKRFLNKLTKKIHLLKPDLIALTGDFLCHARLYDPNLLTTFLNQFQAPYGCFAVLGNHDYAEYISTNSKGEYDIFFPTTSPVMRAFKKLFSKKAVLTGTTTECAKKIPMHNELVSLLAATPFQLLHNETVTIPIKDSKLNISGLGEYMLGRHDAKTTFSNYDRNFPGIILIHNPDGIPHLKDFPGDIILCGHTHGGQINLPFLWDKFIVLENKEIKQGLYCIDKKWAYINRGLGGVLPLRWFSPPEILLLTLE